MVSGHLQVKTFTEHPAVGGQGAVGGQHVEQLAAGQQFEMELPCCCGKHLYEKYPVYSGIAKKRFTPPPLPSVKQTLQGTVLLFPGNNI